MVPAAAAHPLRASAAPEPGRTGPTPAAKAEARAGLYVHVPFCAVRCAYCDFSSGRLSSAALARYLDALERECVRRAGKAAELTFTSVFFGGGTPSALPARAFRRVAAALRAHYRIAPDAEITLEANPESVRESLLEAWAEGGVNRLSMGAQSFVPGELERLGRIHDAARPAAAFAAARRAGFQRLSLDLMFAFPGHDRRRWHHTLDAAFALEPGHLSAYAFIPEPGTPLGNDTLAGRTAVPDDVTQARLYADLTARAARAGFGMYETSNFCRPGEEARHNLVYWLRRPYVGLGPSAHGFIRGRRYGNAYALDAWAAALERGAVPEALSELESPESRAEETMMLGLRLGTGLALADHAREAALELDLAYGSALREAARRGMLASRGAAWWIPARHRFVADEIIAWIAARARPAAVDSARTHSVPSSAPCPNLPSPVA